MVSENMQSSAELVKKVNSLTWYHTLELGDGIITKGIFNLRPYLKYYGIPDDLSGKTVLDIGAASGFFSFEFEKRNAKVTATELPKMLDHDFGHERNPNVTDEEAAEFMHHPFSLAKKILKSNVSMKYINIYDISPETMGVFDIVFCGSVLNHLKNPINALINICKVTKEMAVIATPIFQDKMLNLKALIKKIFLKKKKPDSPLALFEGEVDGNTWWIPNRSCLMAMARAAGFKRVEWVSQFQLKYQDNSGFHLHGVIHAYK
jgi:tRNA (mo5U34)-methyltransferase